MNDQAGDLETARRSPNGDRTLVRLHG